MRVTPIYLTWLNYLGGFEYFIFLAEKEFGVDVQESQATKENILPNWGKSWGETADTIEKETFRISKERVLVRTQHLTINQLEALSLLRSSPLVQIVYSRQSRRTVLVDTNSFKKYDEGDKLFTLQFTITFTDEIPSQRV